MNHCRRALAARLAKKTLVRPGEDGCWEWTGMTDGARYGKIRVGGEPRLYIRTHRTIEQAAEVAKRERERLYGPAQGGGKGEAAA